MQQVLIWQMKLLKSIDMKIFRICQFLLIVISMLWKAYEQIFGKKWSFH